MPKTVPPPTTALAKPDLEVLALPPGVALLDDNGSYTNRFDFVAGSGNVYRVAQSIKGRWWSCSCKSWIYKKTGERHCKHLQDFGLPPDYQPFEIGRLEIAGSAPAAALSSKPTAQKPAPKPALTAVSGGRKKATPVAAVPMAALPPASLPICKPKTVEMKDGQIVVTFDAKDAAAVFALLAQIQGN